MSIYLLSINKNTTKRVLQKGESVIFGKLFCFCNDKIQSSVYLTMV
jgi:hypothetical protein